MDTERKGASIVRKSRRKQSSRGITSIPRVSGSLLSRESVKKTQERKIGTILWNPQTGQWPPGQALDWVPRSGSGQKILGWVESV